MTTPATTPADGMDLDLLTHLAETCEAAKLNVMLAPQHLIKLVNRIRTLESATPSPAQATPAVTDEQVLDVVDQCFDRGYYNVDNADWVKFARAVLALATPSPGKVQTHTRERYTGDPQVEWDEFWKDIVAPCGALDVEQVKKELADFSMLLHFVPKVYDHATGGAVTYPQTVPSAVCSAIDNHVQDLTEQAREEALEESSPGKADAGEDTRKLLTAASHALRSYQYGNASPDLAESIADRIDAAIQQERDK